MTTPIPLLPTTVVGSYGLPSWLWAADEWITLGLFGPVDLEETYNDAVDRAILDQQVAGIDIITDGEMRRRGFVQTFAGRITGLKNVGAPRKVGEIGIDQDPVFETTGKVEVPHGLEIVEEFRYLKAHTDRAIKVTVPGPFALTSFYKPVEYYKDRTQVDEPATPGYGHDPHTAKDIVRLFNACVEGVRGVKFAMHICFGTYKKIPYAKKTYTPYFPAILDARVDQFVFEFATREMYEIEHWPKWAPDRELCAGVIDIRTTYVETPEDVAEKIRRALQYVPAEKLSLSPDCGMRRVARYIAFGKLKALAAGARIVREELTGKA